MILERPEEPGKKYALAFTFAVHALLLAVLFFGVQWKRSPPEVYEVELWSARPTPAVQPAPAPVSEPEPPKPEPKPEPRPEPRPEPKPIPKVVPPAPIKPDIAIKEDKKKPEPKKPEPPKPEPKPEPKKPEPPKPEPKKPEPPKFDFSKELANETTSINKARSDAVTKQQLANAAAAEAEAREVSKAAADKKGKTEYANKIRIKIRSNIMLPANIQGNPEAVFKVDQLPGGEVLDVRLTRSSGNGSLDAAIERAIRKSSPLPLPDNPALFERTLEIKYRPFE